MFSLVSQGANGVRLNKGMNPDQYDHIAGFLVTCPQGCFAPYWISCLGREHSRTGGHLTIRAQLEHRKCKRCGEPVAIEAVWATADEKVAPGAPAEVPLKRW